MKVLLFFVFLCASVCSTYSKSHTLELVHVLFRHGDRTPDRHFLYPKDPHINASYHPFGYGQLTNKGKRTQYLLGKALRKRYREFLGPYTAEVIDARSTAYNRTKMSLELVLASLFPPENELIWEKKLKWQPVPFNYWPPQHDQLLAESYNNCPKYKQLYDEFTRSERARKMYENYTNVANYLETHTGINKTSRDMAEIYFTLTVEKENGLSLPNWTRTIYPSIAKDLAFMEYEVSTATTEMKRLCAGFLFSKIIDDTQRKIKNMLPQKMFLYSAHEYNIAYLMLLLGIYYPHIPPYGAYFVVEIHNIKGVRGIKIFYQDYQTDKPQRMKLPKCQHFCRFEKFVKLYEKYLIQPEKECDLD